MECRRAAPSRAELTAFVVGDLCRADVRRASPTTSSAVPTCEAALQALDDLADPLLARLRQPADGDGIAGRAGPRRLLARSTARSARGAGPPGSPAPSAAAALGKFELLEELGAGSFGHVFRARDTELDRMVAIKILRAGRLASRGGRRRVPARGPQRRPAQAPRHRRRSTRPARPRTAPATWSRSSSQGTTLASRLGDGPLASRQAAELVAAVADALDYAHRHGVDPPRRQAVQHPARRRRAGRT